MAHACALVLLSTGKYRIRPGTIRCNPETKNSSVVLERISDAKEETDGP